MTSSTSKASPIFICSARACTFDSELWLNIDLHSSKASSTLICYAMPTPAHDVVVCHTVLKKMDRITIRNAVETKANFPPSWCLPEIVTEHSLQHSVVSGAGLSDLIP